MSLSLRPLSTRAITRAVAVVVLARLAYVAVAPKGPTAATPEKAAPSAAQKVLDNPLLKAIALADSGDLNAGAAAIESELKRKDSALGRNALGVVRFRQGNKEAARKEFDAAIALDKDFADAYFNRAGLRAAAGDTAGALADYEKVLSLKPEVKQQVQFAESEKARLAKLTGGKK